MNGDLLDYVPLGVLFLAMVGFAWLALEGGYRLGRWRHVRVAEERETPVGAIVASILGLLAFLLAFTFQMAASRFDARRQVVLEEANAIGTTALRARLLPEPERKAILALLRDYVEARIQGVQGGDLPRAIAKSETLQNDLWSQARNVSSNKNADPVLRGLFVQSLNEMIDVHAKRVQAGLRSRIPISIWIGLFALSLLAMAAVGYHSGLSATRRSPAMFGMVLAFAGVLFLIADLDRGHEGFLVVSQEAMLDLRQSIQGDSP